jgi:hypothetical protein
MNRIHQKLLFCAFLMTLMAGCGGGGDAGGGVTVTAPASCSSQAFTWTVGSNTCAAGAGPANSGQNVTATDAAAPAVGSAVYTCTNGIWSGPTSATCAVPPAPPDPGTTVTLYFSDCQTGAQASCMPGSNANAGTSPSSPKQNLAGMNVNALGAGSRLLFARGGAWTGVNISLQNLHATPDHPLVFDSYAPSWGGTNRPVFRKGVLFYVFEFGSYLNMTEDGGYTIRNLTIDGSGADGSWGFYLRNNTRNVIIEDNEITNCAIAVYMTNTPAPGLGNDSLIIRNNNIHHNISMGILGDAHNMLIEGNTFSYNNFSGSGFEHAIYLGGHGTNGVVRNNTFTNNSIPTGESACTGGNFTVHGQWDGLLVEGNTIEQRASGGGCYGISINSSYDSVEYFRNGVVRGNRIINLGFVAIALTSAPGVVVENNLIINAQNTYQAGVLIPDRTAGTGDDLDTGAIIRNNTIYFSQAGSGSEGIALRSNNRGSGTNLQVVSNLIYFGAGSHANHYCFAQTALSNFTAFDNNLCYHASGAGSWSLSYTSLAAAQTAGFDVHGLNANPLFVELPASVNNWDDRIQTASPAQNSGHPTRSSTQDRIGTNRDTTPNIGARE